MKQIDFYNNFYKRWLGKCVDIDGKYGAQCWDGVMQYFKELCGIVYNCTRSGYVKDIWELRNSNGILNKFNEVRVMMPGDVAVFKESKSCPSSHIAIFHSDIDGHYGWFFGQNQGGIPYAGGGACFNLCRLPYADTYDTAFRFKEFNDIADDIHAIENGGASLNNIPADFYKENGTFYPNTTIKIRNAPSLKGEDTGLVYKKGMSVHYDGYVKREGYVWISWISTTGVRRWLATGELVNGYNKYPWGTFK